MFGNSETTVRIRAESVFGLARNPRIERRSCGTCSRVNSRCWPQIRQRPTPLRRGNSGSVASCRKAGNAALASSPSAAPARSGPCRPSRRRCASRGRFAPDWAQRCARTPVDVPASYCSAVQSRGLAAEDASGGLPADCTCVVCRWTGEPWSKSRVAHRTRHPSLRTAPVSRSRATESVRRGPNCSFLAECHDGGSLWPLRSEAICLDGRLWPPQMRSGATRPTGS